MKKLLSYDTESKNQIIPITEDLKKIVEESGCKSGTLFAYPMHTTLGVIIQEAVEPNLCEDIFEQLTKIVENDGTKYKHKCSDNPNAICKTDAVNGPSHIRQLLTNQNVVIDIEDGKLSLGQFQDVAAIEFDGPRKNRKVLVKIIED